VDLARVRAKCRAAVKRREEAIHQEEMEAGELNFIPYLDIVTNLLIFLLASVSAGALMGEIDTMAPSTPAADSSSKDDEPKFEPKEQREVKLRVTAGKTLFLCTDVGAGKDLSSKEKAWEKKVYDLFGPCVGSQALNEPKVTRYAHEWPKLASGEYDYAALNKVMYKAASSLWGPKSSPKEMYRPWKTYKAVINADNDVPYRKVISIMDAMRCKIDPARNGPCIIPRQKRDRETDLPVTLTENDKKRFVVEVMKKNEWETIEIEGPGGEKKEIRVPLYEELKNNYDPDKMALFHDIQFKKYGEN